MPEQPDATEHPRPHTCVGPGAACPAQPRHSAAAANWSPTIAAPSGYRRKLRRLISGARVGRQCEVRLDARQKVSGAAGRTPVTAVKEHRPCPFRYIYKGRTFCAVAVRERRFTTARVSPTTCADCSVPQLVLDHPCAHLDVGVEIDEYGPRAEVVFVFTACRVLVEELQDLSQCHPGACRMWEQATDEAWQRLRDRATRRHRLLEIREGKSG